MPDMLQIGASGVLAYQRSLATVSHNIANVNTEGYNRQRVEESAGNMELSPQGVLGGGVQSQTTQRYYDSFLTNQLRGSTSAFNRVDAYYQFSSQIDNLLGDPSVGLSPAMTSFFSAVQEVAKDPTSVPSRQVLATESQVLTARFQAIDTRLSEYQDHTNDQIKNAITEINSLAQGIAELNGRIVTTTSRSSGQPPNDLLDKREQLIQSLSEYTQVNVVKQNNSDFVNVFIGNGQALVLDQTAINLTLKDNEYDPKRLEIYADYGTGNSIKVTDLMSGGKIGGLLDFQNQILDPSRLALGQIAVGISKTFNEQHNIGIDLDGNWGKDFFNTLTPDVLSGNKNQGTASLESTIRDVSQLNPSDYIVKYQGEDGVWQDAASWSISRENDGQPVAIIAGDGTSDSPFVTEDGFIFTVNGGDIGPTKGDSFLIRPAYGLAGQINSLTSDPVKIAASAAVRSTAGLGNLGTGTITPPEVVDTQNSDIKDTIRLSFSDANTFSVSDVQQSKEGSFQVVLSIDPENQTAAYNAIRTSTDAAGNPMPLKYDVRYLGPTEGYAVYRDGILVSGGQGPSFPLGDSQDGTFYSDGFILTVEGDNPMANDTASHVSAFSPSQVTSNPKNLGNVSVNTVPMDNQPLVPLQVVFRDSTHYDVIDLTKNEVVQQNVSYEDEYGTFDYPPNSEAPSWSINLAGQAQAGDTLMLRGRLNQPYQSDQTIAYNGWETKISGVPQAGDYFTVSFNTGGISDNRNALALANIQSEDVLSGNTTDLTSAYGQIVADIGRKTSEAKVNQGAQQGLLSFIQDERNSYSGVNLDEEAANLVYYQQNYQAAAQIVSKADAIFQTLLKAIGG